MAREQQLHVVALYPMQSLKITPQLIGIPVERHFKLKLKQLYRFNYQSLTTKNITHEIHADDTNNYHQYGIIMVQELMQ